MSKPLLIKELTDLGVSRLDLRFLKACGKVCNINTEPYHLLNQEKSSDALAFLGLHLEPDLKYWYIDPFRVEPTAVLYCYSNTENASDPRALYKNAARKAAKKLKIANVGIFCSLYVMENECDGESGHQSYCEEENYNQSFFLEQDQYYEMRAEIASVCNKNLNIKIKHWLGQHQKQICFYLEIPEFDLVPDKLTDFYYIASNVVTSFNKKLNRNCKPSNKHPASETKLFFTFSDKKDAESSMRMLHNHYRSIQAILNPDLECYRSEHIHSKQMIGANAIGISIAPTASPHLAIASILAIFLNTGEYIYSSYHPCQTLSEALDALENELGPLLDSEVFTKEFVYFFAQLKRSEMTQQIMNCAIINH